MNNVFAVGGCAATLTANPNTPAQGLPGKPPSPTAVAINLLNLLKIANTMSHPRYNPFAPGNQMSPQGPYGPSGGQMQRDPQRGLPQLGASSNFISSGPSSSNLGPTGGPMPSLMSLPANYRTERNNITVDEDVDRCLDLNISRAREEAKQNSANQNSQFTNLQKDTFRSSNTSQPSYLTSTPIQEKSSFTADSASSSLDWLPICQRASQKELSNTFSPASSTFQGSGNSWFSTSSNEKRDVSSIPGLGEYARGTPPQPTPPLESTRPKYNSESASNILLHFGLEQEDLESLISYPEDQITPDNLPFILRQIRQNKEKRVSATVQSKPYSEAQSNRSKGETDKSITSREPALTPDQISSAVLKPSKVIDYGHTGKYTAPVGDKAGRAMGSSARTGASGNVLHMDAFKSSRQPPQRGMTELKTQSPVSSRGLVSSSSSVDSLRTSVAPSSSEPAKNIQVQINQTSKSIFPSFALNKDIGMRQLKSEVPQTPPKQPELACQATSKAQPSNTACNLVRGVHPGRPGLVLINRNDTQSNTQGQGLKVPEQTNKLPDQMQKTQQPKQLAQQRAPPPTLQQQQQPQMHQQPFPPFKQMQQPTQPRAVPPANTTPSALITIRPAPPMPAPGAMHAMPRLPAPAFKGQTSVAKTGPSKVLPTPAMMQDYAAATPRIFPHTCCLCMKECTSMKDWLSHQNTSLHLESCRLLRGRYPDWDGNPLVSLSPSDKGTQPSPTSVGQKLQNRQQKSTPDTGSHSHSPQRQRGSEDKREKRVSRSRSRSPHRRYGAESRRQKRISRSRSRSPQRRYTSEGQRERRSSKSPYASRHSRRSRSRSYERPTSSRQRSRSRSYERRSPPRRREARRSSARRSEERRSEERRSHERRSPPERSEPHRKRSSSADILAKRLLETTAVQSLSRKSDLEAMVKTLAPALLAELAKMKSSSSSKTEKNTPSSKSAKASSSCPKSEITTSPKLPLPLPLDKVRLSSVYSSLSYSIIMESLEKFGKVKDLVLFRSTLEAIVHFEKKEDADKLRSLKSFKVKGLPVFVENNPTAATKKPPTKKEQKPASQKESPELAAKSPAEKSPAEKSPLTKKVQTPKSSGATNLTTGQPLTTGKGVAPKQVKSNTGGKNAGTSVQVKKKGPAVQKPQRPVNVPQSDDPKDKITTKPESDAAKPAAAPSKAAEIAEESDKTAEKTQEENIAAEPMDAAPEAEPTPNIEEAGTQPDTLTEKESVPESTASEQPPVDAVAEGEEQISVPENITKTVDTEGASKQEQPEECEKGEPERIQIENVEPDKTEPAEQLEVISSAESKDQVSEALQKPTECQPVAGVKSPPSMSPTETDPPEVPQTSIKVEEMAVEDPPQVQESEIPTEKIETKTEQQESSDRMETKQEAMLETDAESRPEPEPVCNNQAVKSDEPRPAEANPADAAETEADVSSPTVVVKMEKQEPLEEIKCTPMETGALSMPPSEYSANDEQPTLQTPASVSPSPVVSTEPNSSHPVKVESTVSDSKAETHLKENVALSTASQKPIKNTEKRRSQSTPVSTASKKATPAPSTTTMSVTESGKSEEVAAELPHIDEEIFKALTTALQEHRLIKKKTSEEKERATFRRTASEGDEEERAPLTKDESQDVDDSSDFYDELPFDFADFVTVDEINEEMDEVAVESYSSSLEPTTWSETEGQTNNVSSDIRKPSKSSKESNSASSSSKSEKENISQSSSSVSANKQTNSESNKSETKTSPANSCKASTSSKSVETPSTSGQKAKSNKRKIVSKSSEPSSSGQNTRSSAAAIKSSVETHRVHEKDSKPAESSVAKSDHTVSAENCAANNVESQSEIKPSEKNQLTEGEALQIQNLKTDPKEKSVKEMKKGKAKGKKIDTNMKKTEEKGGNNNSKQTLGSVSEKFDLENKEDDQGKKTKTQIPGPEKDQTIHQCGLEVVEGADTARAQLDDSHEMEIDVSTKPQDITPVEQATTADDGDEGPTVMQVSERDEAKQIHRPQESSVSVTSDRDKETSEDTNPTPNSGGDASTLKPKEGILLSEKVCETSKEDGQISNEDQPLETGASKDTLKDQKLVDPTDQLAKSEDKLQEEVYRALDSSEDPPTKATVESEPEKKEGTDKERTTRSGDYRTRESRSRSRTSKSEEKDKPTKQLDKATKKPTTKTSKTKKEEMSVKDLEEPVYEVLDSIEDDAVQEASTNTGRRRSARGKKTDEKILAQVEEPKTSEKVEEIFTVLDSVEDERPEDKAVTTRSTRGRKENATKKVEENAKTRDNKTPRRRTPARDSKEKETEKSTKTDVGVSSKESTPTKMSDTRHKSEESTAHKTLGAVKEEIVKKQTSRRGRPKKDNNATKQQTADLKKGDSPINTVEEDSFKILDSVEDDLTRLDESVSATKSDVPQLDTAKELVGLPLNEEEEEPIYQVVDSLEEEQFQDGLMTETSMQKESETKDDMVKNTDHLPSGSSTVELSEQTGGQENTLLQSPDKPSEVKEDPSVKKPETKKKGITSKADVQKVDRPPLNKPDRNLGVSDKMLKSAKRDEAKSKENVLVNLDQVSEEEEDYPDDAAEEKELMKRQAAARKRETDREEKRSREREARERRSRSSSRGGGSGKPSNQTEKKCQEDLEKVDLDKQDLVTLDEVGEDEVGEEGLPEAPTWHREISEAELLELVTLDEIAEEEDGQVETLPQSPENQPVDSVTPETLSALTETVQTEDKKDDNEETKQPPSSSKRKQSDNTEESGNFVTVDELGEVEKEEKETVTRGRPRKRSRQTPGRKSTRGKGVKEEHQRQEEENKSLPPASLDSSPIVEESTPGPSGDHQPESQNIDEENHSEAASAEPQPLTDGPDGQKAEGIEEVKQEHSRPSVKVGDKRKQEVSGPEAKRSRSQSPGVPVDLHLTPSNSTGPCGQEYVVPKSGFYCNLCSIFYFNETTAMEVHCSSQKHYDNLLKHNQRLQQTPQLTSAQDVEASLSD
ncbi:PREDICTED: zinc finger protein 638-like [Cyprinodon variegatus]|uniref:Zinc finger protein 638-like n=1 Tax=Cyprinodon variegatus TaxID=28743 RepID=A0A3Q2E3J5_CYPVA|nr:PREDICTED: zinc finger protein 638-like [Cyprinodon variegatus]